MSVTVEQSRTIPLSVEQAYDGTLPAALTALMAHRFGPFPPVVEVRDQVGPWGSVGQTRTIVSADGGTLREELLTADRPTGFSYRLDHVTGPLGLLVSQVDGLWSFVAASEGTTITWRWSFHPRLLRWPLVAVLGRLWHGYADRALQALEAELTPGVRP